MVLSLLRSTVPLTFHLYCVLFLTCILHGIQNTFKENRPLKRQEGFNHGRVLLYNDAWGLLSSSLFKGGLCTNELCFPKGASRMFWYSNAESRQSWAPGILLVWLDKTKTRLSGPSLWHIHGKENHPSVIAGLTLTVAPSYFLCPTDNIEHNDSQQDPECRLLESELKSITFYLCKPEWFS